MPTSDPTRSENRPTRQSTDFTLVQRSNCFSGWLASPSSAPPSRTSSHSMGASFFRGVELSMFRLLKVPMCAAPGKYPLRYMGTSFRSRQSPTSRQGIVPSRPVGPMSKPLSKLWESTRLTDSRTSSTFDGALGATRSTSSSRNSPIAQCAASSSRNSGTCNEPLRRTSQLAPGAERIARWIGARSGAKHLSAGVDDAGHRPRNAVPCVL